MSNKSLKQWLYKLETSHNKKIDLGLERVRQVYNNLKLKKIAATIITVAGTNGKGSTTAILSSICQQAGYKVGEFTSPHIVDYNERIKINSKNIDDKSIINAFMQIEDRLDDTTLSYFEYSTLAAAIIFRQQKVDIAILEVGLGGRLDSVNVIDSDCAIITTIDIDHTSWLGNTIEKIAFEKAGIMRKQQPIIYGDKNCPQAIIEYAKKIKAKLIFAVEQNYGKHQLNILGQYQQLNANTAIAALEQLSSLNIDNLTIKKGLKNIKLPARLQVISHNPTVILDVSHNQQAVIKLANWLAQNPIRGKTIAVFAVLADKQAINWLKYFKETINIWCISAVECNRAMPTSDLLLALANSAKLITSHKSVATAFITAKIMADKTDRIIVFGSFYTVSETHAS